VALIYKQEVFKIIGAAMEVHSTLGPGFLEAVYKEALALELQERTITFEQEKLINITYKDIVLQKHYCADFICYDKIILEIKALSGFTSEHEAQLLNYLKATQIKIGLLINFGKKSLDYKRYIF
jgi:GxxExxY protein